MSEVISYSSCCAVNIITSKHILHNVTYGMSNTSNDSELGREEQEVVCCGNSCCNSLHLNKYIFALACSKKPRGFPLFLICFEATFVVCGLSAASELC